MSEAKIIEAFKVTGAACAEKEMPMEKSRTLQRAIEMDFLGTNVPPLIIVIFNNPDNG